jgi:hypothetical protein
MSVIEKEVMCKVPGCPQTVHARGFCQKHYIQIWRMGIANKNVKCKVNGCDNPVHAKCYCRKHYTQIWRKGEISLSPPCHVPREPTRGMALKRIRMLELELKKVDEMYNHVVGFENRLRWRREKVAVQNEIGRLQEAVV